MIQAGLLASRLRFDHRVAALHEHVAASIKCQSVPGPLILAPFDHQLHGTVMVWPTVGKYRLQVATVFPDASLSTVLLS